MKLRTPGVLLAALSIVILTAAPCRAQGTPAKGETQKIAEKAFVYAFPMVMGYGIL